jgi:hypothetical protein
LALRELLGEGAPLSASSLQRLKEKWQGEYEQWKSTGIEEKDWVARLLRINLPAIERAATVFDSRVLGLFCPVSHSD